MSTDNIELPLALRNEWRKTQRDLDTIPTLESHLVQIRKHGMSVRAAVSIESHFPGLLLPKAPTAFSYQSTNQNVEYSQEAIGEKISGFLKKSKEVFDKVVAWIIEQCKNIRSTFTKERFKAAAEKVNKMTAKPNKMAVSDVIRQLGDKVTLYDEHPIVLKMSEILGIDVTLDRLENVRKESDGQAWVTHLLRLTKQDNIPLMVYPDRAKNVLAKLKAMAEEMDTETLWLGVDEALSKRGDVDNNWDTVNAWYFKFPSQSNLQSAYKSACDGTAITAMLGYINELEHTVEKYDKQHKDIAARRPDKVQGDGATAHKKAGEFIELMKYTIKLYRTCLSNSLTMLAWTSFSMHFVSSENVQQVMSESNPKQD